MEFYLWLPENDIQLEFQLSLHSIDWTTQKEVYQMIFIWKLLQSPHPGGPYAYIGCMLSGNVVLQM